MPETEKGRVIVIGHKNPDTDSICSAIAYAYLKRKQTGQDVVPRRAGSINQETEFVLKYFGVDVPELTEDVRTQVKDCQFRRTAGVSRNISLKKAWSLMKEANVVTLPIVKNETLEGLITIGDIANSYMDVYDSRILAKAKTQYANIVETIEGSVVVGKAKAYFDCGKVLIAAANPDLMESYIEKGDLVILGNRYESQLCAIEMNAACIIVCEGAAVSMTIRKLAEEHGCTVISSPFDTYTVARLINQSMPIRYFMKTEGLITFNTDDYIDEIKEVMASKRHRDFPILDEHGNYVGMLSRRNLLGAQGKRVILVDHNERSQSVDGIESAEILEIIDHHRLGTIETMSPVFFRNQPLGCTATIVFQMYREAGEEIPKEIAGLLCSAIISDTLLYRSPTCTPVDRAAAEELAKIAGIDTKEYAREMFAAGSNLSAKTDAQVFYQDYKEFTVGDKTMGIGQINSMNVEELAQLRNRLLPFLEEVRERQKVDMVFFMLTSILDESTELIYTGSGCRQMVESAFPGAPVSEDCAFLYHVVSRKKQLVPALVMTLQQ